MGMEEKGARVRRREAVAELLARLHRHLGDIWHAVHRVCHAYAMPMDGAVLFQAVGKRYVDSFALARAQHRERRIRIAPHRSRASASAKHSRALFRTQANAARIQSR